MPKVRCPFEDCQYETEDTETILVAALLNTHAMIHSGGKSTSRAIKIQRPTIATAGSTEDWAYFKLRWSDYKDATNITGRELIIQLLECCEESLRKDVMRTAGESLVGKSEDDVLTAIHSLAVREENTTVARVTLHQMTQDVDETVRSYYARLKGQATVCKLTVSCKTCNKDVDYTDEAIKSVLVHGLNDSEIQLDVLGHNNQNMNLEDTVKLIEAKEAGRRSAQKLIPQQGSAATSSYQRTTRTSMKNKTMHQEATCTYCGEKGHGKWAPLRVRQKTCKGFGHLCTSCGKKNHLEKVCRSGANAGVKAVHQVQIEDKSLNTFCSISCDMLGDQLNALEHYRHIEATDTWKKHTSMPQPYMNIQMTIDTNGYQALNISNNITPRSITVKAMADTGCQSCLAGINVMQKIGLQEKDLVPVRMSMRAANERDIQILGAIIVKLSCASEQEKLYNTRQLLYITNAIDKVFLSREACIDLRLISKKFPTVGEQDDTMDCEDNALHSANSDIICNCPRRKMPPPMPSSLPYPATEANRKNLESYLLEYYKASTFNMCETA